MIKEYFFGGVLFLGSFACTAPIQEKVISQPILEDTILPAVSSGVLSIETIKTELGWGYHILKDGRPFIRQYNIPAIPGNKGFTSEQKAKTAALFILNKIKTGQMPPSTNKAELDSLGLL
jgi:hypothetical protein